MGNLKLGTHPVTFLLKSERYVGDDVLLFTLLTLNKFEVTCCKNSSDLRAFELVFAVNIREAENRPNSGRIEAL